jgi:hypothetical protein
MEVVVVVEDSDLIHWPLLLLRVWQGKKTRAKESIVEVVLFLFLFLLLLLLIVVVLLMLGYPFYSCFVTRTTFLLDFRQRTDRPTTNP